MHFHKYLLILSLSIVYLHSTSGAVLTTDPQPPAPGNVSLSRTELPALDSFDTLPIKKGGWIIIQRRGFSDELLREDFNRTYGEYENGFGDFHGDFWIGLKAIHELTSKLGASELKIIMWDWNGNQRYARYTAFTVNDRYDRYRMKVTGYSGTAGDSLKRHNEARFSTIDSDNDSWNKGNCARRYEGGWWFESCLHSNLNGMYKTSSTTEYGKGLQWLHFQGHYYSLKSTEMMIRLPPD